MHSAMICSVEPCLAKPDDPVSETSGSEISRNSDESSEMMMTDPDDWRTPLVYYLENPGHIVDRKVWRQALKYAFLDNTLYRQAIDGLLLKCLGSDQSKIAMVKIHEGICGTHQSAHTMKCCFVVSGSFGQLCLMIVLGTTKDVNRAKSSEMCNWLLQLCCIL
jgi:hypothetical protein